MLISHPLHIPLYRRAKVGEDVSSRTRWGGHPFMPKTMRGESFLGQVNVAEHPDLHRMIPDIAIILFFATENFGVRTQFIFRERYSECTLHTDIQPTDIAGEPVAPDDIAVFDSMLEGPGLKTHASSSLMIQKIEETDHNGLNVIAASLHILDAMDILPEKPDKTMEVFNDMYHHLSEMAFNDRKNFDNFRDYICSGHMPELSALCPFLDDYKASGVSAEIKKPYTVADILASAQNNPKDITIPDDCYFSGDSFTMGGIGSFGPYQNELFPISLNRIPYRHLLQINGDVLLMRENGIIKELDYKKPTLHFTVHAFGTIDGESVTTPWCFVP